MLVVGASLSVLTPNTYEYAYTADTWTADVLVPALIESQRIRLTAISRTHLEGQAI